MSMGTMFYRRDDQTKCQAQVWGDDSWHPHPCQRKAVVVIRWRHLCRQHAAILIERVARKEVAA